MNLIFLLLKYDMYSDSIRLYSFLTSLRNSYTENIKKMNRIPMTTKELQELLGEFSKVVGYKVNRKINTHISIF